MLAAVVFALSFSVEAKVTVAPAVEFPMLTAVVAPAPILTVVAVAFAVALVVAFAAVEFAVAEAGWESHPVDYSLVVD